MYCEETLRQLLVIRVITDANTTRIMKIATNQSQMPGTPLDEVRAREVTILYVCIHLFSNNFGTLYKYFLRLLRSTISISNPVRVVCVLMDFIKSYCCRHHRTDTFHLYILLSVNGYHPSDSPPAWEE
jgi:hypothetical protein